MLTVSFVVSKEGFMWFGVLEREYLVGNQELQVGCLTRRNLQHPSQSVVGGPRGHAVFTDVDALGISRFVRRHSITQERIDDNWIQGTI
jgi:hypothetical protein